MRKKILFYKLLILLLLGMVFCDVKSQDIHFSQFMNSPLNLNPAATGFSNSQYRFFLNHKNQWASVTIPFVTYSTSVDFYLFKRRHKADMLGIGLMANSDKAGDSKYGTNQAYLSLSYIRALGKSNQNVISFGINGGYSQRSIDYSKLTFDNQFNGTIFDPSITSIENLKVENFSYLDFAAGIKLLNIISKEVSINSGLAVWHLNQAKQSLMENNAVRLNPKIVFQTEGIYLLTNEFIIYPAFFFASQGKYKEIVFGGKIKNYFNSKVKNSSALEAGLYLRNKDAVIIYLGLDYNNFLFAGSYDLNVSTLKAASRYMGGMEFSVQYAFNKNKVKKIKELPCPIF